MDIHDIRARSKAGIKYLLVVVEKARKLLFAYPLPSTTAKNVGKKLLKLL